MAKYSSLKTVESKGIPISFDKKEYSVRIREISNGFLLCESWVEGKHNYKDKETYYKTKEEISKLDIKV